MTYKKALLVDDDLEFLIILKWMIETILPCEVVTAENGSEALYRFQQDGSIDLIVTDTNMPICNGIDLIKGIRETNQNVPIIIFFSGLLTDQSLKEADVETIGATVILEKPPSSQRLSNAIKPLYSIVPAQH